MLKSDVIAITVTYNRIDKLINTVKSLENQEKEVDKIIIVDNCSNEKNKEGLRIIEKNSDKIEVIWLEENLGGAGGFYIGMEHALEKYDPNWYWIMDDDAYPTNNCLFELMKYKEKLKDIGFLAPAIYGIDNKKYQMYHHKLLSKYKVNDITAVDDYNSLKEITNIEANAFVGPIFPRNVIKELGLPDKDLFIYGDDTEYTYRITRKYKGYLIKNAIINHQDPPYVGKVVAPSAWWKEYYMFRNRFLFVNKFEKNLFNKSIAKIYLILHLAKRILATMIKNHYKNYRKIRVNILSKAILDGINNKSGKTIDPVEYMKSL